MRHSFGRLLLWLALALGSGGAMAQAQQAPEPSALDQQVQRITSELRCLVCQNQTIADSHADLAQDLRQQVRQMLQQGRSEREVIDYMTQRYGDFVLYRPPMKATTWLLWFGPALLLAAGVLTLAVVLRRRARLPAEAFEPDEDDAPDDRPDDRSDVLSHDRDAVAAPSAPSDTHHASPTR